jgi:beta-glucosidase
MGKPFLACVVAAGVASIVMADDERPPFRDPALPVDVRVADLVGRMNLEEKVAQLTALWLRKDQISDEQARFSPEGAAKAIPHGLGQLARPSEIATTPTGPRSRGPRDTAVFVGAVQQWLAKNTRLGIPVMTHEEALHGLSAPRGTHFPIPLALASTWDPALVERVMAVAALEARTRGTHQVLSPVLDLARDPRWGRTEETYGEDQFLVSRLGAAAIRGYQGPSEKLGADKVFATMKHFAGHGTNEGGINTAPGTFPERLLREEYLYPFQHVVATAGPLSLMPSYNEIDGVPLHANEWLLGTVLRGEWGFRGLVVSDYFAIDQLKDRHGVAGSLEDAARMSLEAGVDLELPDPKAYGAPLVEMVKNGRVSEATVDRAVARVLRAKFLAGLFEDTSVDPERAEAVANRPEHQALALEAARQAIVLLKNDKGLLPLDAARVRTLAVIGPNAAGVYLGGYSNDPGRGVSVLQGIKDHLGAKAQVLHAEGVKITEHEGNWSQDQVIFGDPARNRRRITEAVATARRADLVLLVLGTNSSMYREAYADNHLGDRSDISLPSQQDELFDAVAATGKPVVVLLLAGGPLAVPDLAERAGALVQAFFLGQEGGTAVAEVLFGKSNPGGKLPISVPRHVGQIPAYYSRRPTSLRSYVDLPREPLFPFGHGLSYTTFRIENVKVSPQSIGTGGRAEVTAEVVNTGARAGDEVVQLYIHQKVASVTRPVKSLRGFERVRLEPGQRRTVRFTLGPDHLSLVDRNMKWTVEPGVFEVMVGNSSAGLTPAATLEVVSR